MSRALAATQIGLSLVLVSAATGKILSSQDFAATLRLSRFDDRLVRMLTPAVPTVELAIAGALVVSAGMALQITMGAATVLMAAFTAWMVSVRARGISLRCACFGSRGAPVGPRTMLRNAVFAAVALGGLVASTTTDSALPGPSGWMVLATVGGAVTVMLVVAFAFARPNLILSLKQVYDLQPPADHGVV
jgi:hypothetical protein